MGNAAEAASAAAVSLDLSCPDWRERLRTGRTLVPDLPFLYSPEAERAVAIYNKLRLADVPGTPAIADAGGEWFRMIVRGLLGSLDPETATRLVRELFLLVPKKNSKTTSGALGIMLTALLMNVRPRANFILTAPVQETAEIAFSAVSGAVEIDPVLEKKLHVREHLKTIIHRETKAELEIVTFDPAVLTGRKVSGGVLIDELHVVAKMAKAASAIRQLRGGMIPFPEAFLAFITTQSEEPPTGAFKAELDKARAIRDGKRKGSMLPVLYEFPAEMQQDPEQWKDPANWPMVNPNSGKSISIGRLVEDMEDASQKGEGELRAWASQHLNIEIGLALHSNRWTGADFWEKCAAAVTLNDLLKRSEVVTIGIDGGGLDDMLALVVLGRETGTGKWLHWARAWIHPIVLERRKAESERFRSFESDGDLVIVEVIGDDIAELADIVKRVYDTGLLAEKGIGVDQAGIGAIIDAIVALGIVIEMIVGIPQGWRLQTAIKTIERKLAEGAIEHGDRPLMAWSVGNCKVEPRGNAIMITKQNAGSAKIDPAMATFNAGALMAMNPKPTKKNYDILFM